MKKFLIMVLCTITFFPFMTSAQTEKEDKTWLESLLEEKDKLILVSSHTLGKITSERNCKVEFKAVESYNPEIGLSKTRGFQVVITKEGRDMQSNMAFIDFSELEKLSKDLKFMIRLAEKFKTVNKEYTKVFFSTKGGFEVGFIQKGTGQATFFSVGRTKKVECLILSIDDLNSVKVIVDKGWEFLKEIK